MTKDKHDLGAILALKDEFLRRDTRVVSVTIARGGSRRLPRKNLAPYCGRPLVEWSIIQSLCSHLVTDTYLSTDDEEIAEVGRRAGAKILWRYEPGPAGTIANVTFCHAIRQIRELQPVDALVTSLPTNPLRQPWDIDEAIRLYWDIRSTDRRVHSITPLVPVLELFAYRKLDSRRAELALADKSMAYLDGAGATWTVVEPDWYLSGSSLVPPTDAENDRDIKGNSDALNSYGESAWFYFYPVELWQRQDIDLPEHLQISEQLMRHFILDGRGAEVYHEYKARAAQEARA